MTTEIPASTFATLDSFTGRDRNIVAHLTNMKPRVKQLINGLVVERTSFEWVWNVGAIRGASVTTAIEAIRAAG